MKYLVVTLLVVLLFSGCDVADIGRPEEVRSTGTYYTQIADVEFVVTYSDGSTKSIVETISNTRTPMQGVYRHEMEVDGIKFYGIEVDFEDFRLLGTWDNTVDNITFNSDGSYSSTSFGSGSWNTDNMQGIYLNGAGPYYYGFTYTDPDEFIEIGTTVDLKKM